MEKDFAADGQELVVKPFDAADKKPTAEIESMGGWKTTASASPITFNGATAYVLLTTFTGFGKTTSVFATLNDHPMPIYVSIPCGSKLTILPKRSLFTK